MTDLVQILVPSQTEHRCNPRFPTLEVTFLTTSFWNSGKILKNTTPLNPTLKNFVCRMELPLMVSIIMAARAEEHDLADHHAVVHYV